MNFVKQEINFRKVVAGDTFDPVLEIDPEFELITGTEFLMEIRPYGDIPQEPTVSFRTGESVTIDGQKLRFNKPGESMELRPGKYKYDGQFTRQGVVTTLFGGLFEIVKSSQPTD